MSKDKILKLLDDCKLELGKARHMLDLETFPIECHSYINNYLLIKVCSSVEQVCKNLLYFDLQQGCSSRTCSYLERVILRPTLNPSIKQIKELLNRIDPNLKKLFSQKLKALPDSDKIQKEFNSLVENRNFLAHGRCISVTLRDIENYFSSASQVISALNNSLVTDITEI